MELLKSGVSMDCEMSMASMMSRTGWRFSMGFSIHTGRAQAISTSPHTSMFSSSCARLPRKPSRSGLPPMARLMPVKNGTRIALRASR
ncbi:hypothetical protein D3C81_1683500 [compost metagenome]